MEEEVDGELVPVALGLLQIEGHERLLPELERQPPELVDPAVLHGRRALVVEDNETNRKMQFTVDKKTRRSYIDLEELGKREGISFKSHY